MEIKLGKLLQKKNQWVVMLLVGVLLVVIAIPTKKESGQNTQSSYENAGSATEMEKRLEHLLSNMQDVGKVQVMITTKDDGQVEGIVVLAEGAKDGVVIKNITEVVQALFDVDAHKIRVIRSNFHH